MWLTFLVSSLLINTQYVTLEHFTHIDLNSNGNDTILKNPTRCITYKHALFCSDVVSVSSGLAHF